jgi:hypothetical protein
MHVIQIPNVLVGQMVEDGLAHFDKRELALRSFCIEVKEIDDLKVV